MKLYKLTDQNMQTFQGFQWELGVPAPKKLGKNGLCGFGWYHAYTSPLLAILLNPIHADIANPRLFEAEGEIEESDHGLKVGCRTLTLTKEIPIPKISIEQRIRFAILCTKMIYNNSTWNLWADNWLSNKDRTAQTARMVEMSVNELGAIRTVEAAIEAGISAEIAANVAELVTGEIEIDLESIIKEAMAE